MLDQMTDPDYYYHVAFSRQMAEQGLPRTLPQVEGIGWHIIFSDKEFLFHVLTTFMYNLFGEAGVRAVPLFVSGLTTLALALTAIKRLTLRWFWLPFLVLACDPYFLRRMIMVRPQVLAVFFFVILIIGLLERKKFMIAMAAALFTLSYHALQIPVLLAAAAVAGGYGRTPKERDGLVYLGIGLVIGVLINPYFPGNIAIIPQIFEIVLDAQSASGMNYGREIYAWRTSELMTYSPVLLFIAMLALLQIGRDSQNPSAADADRKWLLILTGGFFAISLMTPRGREYMVPALFFLSVVVLRSPVPWEVRIKKWVVPSFLFFTSIALVQVAAVRRNYSALFREKPQHYFEKALTKIPADEKARVFNCNWSDSPFIFYYRPNLSFVDILDPSFLYLQSKPLHSLRADFNRLQTNDNLYVVNKVFQAKYVLCDSGEVNEKLDQDPRFRRLYPEEPVGVSPIHIALFAVAEETSDRFFARDFEYRVSTEGDAPPQTWKKITNHITIPQSPPVDVAFDFIDFKRQIPENELSVLTQEVQKRPGVTEKEMSLNCVHIQPTAQEISRFQGAHFVGVGGGPNIRAWLNDQALFESRGENETSAIVQTLIPLPRPLAAADSLRFMVCPGVSRLARYYGLSVSFYKRSELDALCHLRNEDDSLAQRDRLPWAYKGDAVKTCLGNVAAKK